MAEYDAVWRIEREDGSVGERRIRTNSAPGGRLRVGVAPFHPTPNETVVVEFEEVVPDDPAISTVTVWLEANRCKDHSPEFIAERVVDLVRYVDAARGSDDA